MNRTDMEWVGKLDVAVRNFNGHSSDRRAYYSFLIWQFGQPQSQQPDVVSIREELASRIRDQHWVDELVADFECANELLDEFERPMFPIP